MTSFKFFLILSFFLGVTAMAQESSIGKLAFVTGEVFVNGKPGANGQGLSIGTKIVTREGKCALLFGERSVVHLDANSKFEISTYSLSQAGVETAEMKLEYGRTRALVRDTGKEKKKFNFRSRTAVLGVRGTHVYIDSPRDASVPQQFMTISGRAELTLPASGGSAATQASGGSGKKAGTESSQKVTLSTNESTQVGGGAQAGDLGVSVQKLSEGTVAKLAQEVAAAPMEVKTPGDAKSLQRNDRGEDGKGDDVGDRRPPKPPLSQIPLDPVADGGILKPARIQVKLFKKNI